MPFFDASEYQSRISSLKEMLATEGIDAAVLNQSSDLYYFSGSVLPLYLVVPASGDAFLLARKADDRITREAPFLKFEPFSSSKDLSALWSAHGLKGASRLGFSCDSSSYSTVTRMSSLSPQAEVAGISFGLRLLRARKSPSEIMIMRKAGAVIARMPKVIKESYRSGMTELELSAHIERFFRLEGNGVIDSKQEGLVLGYGVTSAGLNSLEGNKFDGVCAGKGLSRALPAGASRDVIPESTAIVFDYGFVLEGYHVDMTRMGSVGKPPPAATQAYDAMLRIEEALIETIRPGDSWESAWDLALGMARGAGYEDAFMGLGRDKVRFVGHGVGIQLDEPPYLAPKMPALIEEGMTIAIEPKVSLAGVGVVGVEDTILVGLSGNELITPAAREIMVL